MMDLLLTIFSNYFIYDFGEKIGNSRYIKEYLDKNLIINGKELNAEHLDRDKKRINKLKVELANIVIRDFDNGIPDSVKSEIENLCEFIKKANGEPNIYKKEKVNTFLIK